MSRTVIWGTSVSVADTKKSFRDFLNNFTEEGEETPKYERMLDNVCIHFCSSHRNTYEFVHLHICCSSH